MHPLTRICHAALMLVLSTTAHARTATEIFESASVSVVVVYGNDTKGNPISQGSGVVLPGGAVITNCHVIDDAARLVVKHQQREYPATLKHADYDRDVCSLTAQGLQAAAAQLGTTRTLKVGQRVYAIGAPSGLELTLSEGLVSSLRAVDGGQYIQTSAPISPGSSGGGLFDEDGRLIGLPTFYLAEGQQLNFAVPVEWVKELPQRQVAAQKSGTTTLEWLNKAIELGDKEDWPALVRHAQRWTESSPREEGAWYALGLAYRKAGQTAKAIEAYQQSLRIDPEYAEAWYNLGIAYGKAGRKAKEIEAYQQALRIDPEDAEAWYNLGIAYGEASQTAKEIEAYQQALRIDPENAMTWYNLGIAYKIDGQSSRVMEVYRQLKALSPQDADEFFTKVILP